MSALQWFFTVICVLTVLAGAWEAAHNDADLAFSLIIVMGLAIAGLMHQNHQRVDRTNKLIEECFDQEETAVRFKGGIYIGCFKK